MTASSYSRGIAQDDPAPKPAHAGRTGDRPGALLALCDGRGLASVPGRFDPDDENSCRDCAKIVRGQAV